MSDERESDEQARDNGEPRLYLRFHGRIIDSLGIQMYQSPVAAIAELIANAWDADASTVDIQLPANLTAGAEISIVDNGLGMTLVPEMAVEAGLLAGTNVVARHLDAEHPSRSIALVWRRNSPREKEFRLLAEALKAAA